MRCEKSYGIIPLSKQSGEWHVLIVQQLHGQHWGFPKGHANQNESPQEAAIRELFEETGLIISTFLSSEALEEIYLFKREGHLTHKTVFYFLAEVANSSTSLVFQTDELSAIKWVPLKEVEEHVTFNNTKELALKAKKLLLV